MMRLSLPRALCAAFVVAVWMATASHLTAGELIDRVIAVVNGSVITQSDVRAAMRLGLVDVSVPSELGRAAGQLLIERRLMLGEVNRYAPPEPDAALVDSRLAEIRRRFASDQEFQRTLEEVGLSVEQLRGHVRDDLRIAAYLQQRFAGVATPSDQDLLTYYREHQEQFMRDGAPMPFNEAAPAVRAAIVEDRRATQIREWVASVRRRADITIPAVVRR